MIVRQTSMSLFAARRVLTQCKTKQVKALLDPNIRFVQDVFVPLAFCKKKLDTDKILVVFDTNSMIKQYYHQPKWVLHSYHQKWFMICDWLLMLVTMVTASISPGNGGNVINIGFEIWLIKMYYKLHSPLVIQHARFPYHGSYIFFFQNIKLTPDYPNHLEYLKKRKREKFMVNPVTSCNQYNFFTV